jgi:hypothetical protein
MSEGASYALIIVDFRVADGFDVDLVLDSAPVIIVGVTAVSNELRTIIEHRGGTIIVGPIELALRSKVDSVLTLH